MRYCAAIARRVWLSMLALFIALSVHEARSASIIDYRLSLESDVTARGDRIAATILLGPNDHQVTLEVTPVYSCSPRGPFKPVPGTRRDSLPIRVEVLNRSADAQPEQAKARLFQVEADVPYALFRLRYGVYYLGYELRVFSGNREQYVQPIPVSRFEFTPQETNKTREIEYGVRKPVFDTRTTKGYSVDADGKLSEFEFSEAQGHMVPEKRVKTRVDDGIRRAPVGEGVTATAPLSSVESPTRRTVYFGTNRRDNRRRNRGIYRFESTPDALTYGSCVVNIPISHYRSGGRLPQRTWFWQSADPERYFMVQGLNVFGREAFVGATREQDLFLFVHGFDNSFEECLYRTAQLKHEMNFRGKPVAFSWPSMGRGDQYRVDERHNKESVAAMANFLDALWRNKGDGRIFVLAHSMGNRLLVRAVNSLSTSGRLGDAEQLFAAAALIAPDVAPAEFANMCPAMIRHSGQVAYYYSSNDRALGLSRVLHLNKQAGLSFFHIQGMETIDAAEADGGSRFSAGHSYYVTSPLVRYDLRLYFLFGLHAADRRPPLSAMLQHPEQMLPYWKLDPSSFAGSAMYPVNSEANDLEADAPQPVVVRELMPLSDTDEETDAQVPAPPAPE